MTDIDAKELLIDGMNYAAYKEADHSLWPCDKNRLFGAVHYEDTARTASVWGEGEACEVKMAVLLLTALRLGTTKGEYKQAVEVLRSSQERCISRVIRHAGL